MRKIVKIFSVILVGSSLGFAAIRVGEAAPAYGTKMPQKNQFFVGGQSHYVLERKLEQEHGEMNSLQHFLLISYGLTEWFSLDLKGGAGNIRQKADAGDEIVHPSFVGGGYGFRLRLYEQDKTKAVFGFQHISIHPYSPHIGPVKNKAVLDDWQLSLLASRKVADTTPYLGMKWSRMDYIHWVDDERNRKKSDLTKSIGVIAGIDIPLSEKVWVNLEGQFVDVQAAACSLNFSF